MGTQSISLRPDQREGAAINRMFVTFGAKEQLTFGWDGTTAALAAAQAAQQIVDTYTLISDWVPCDGLSAGMIYLNLITADATTIEAQVDHSPDKTLIAKAHYRESPEDATVTSAPTETQFTVATYTPATTLALPIPLELRPGIRWWRLKVKRTNGTSAATTCKAYWVGARQP
jgi:hypothetical protein